MKEITPGVTVDREVRFGKPVIKGTRVPVGLVIGKLAGGLSVKQVMEEYFLRREDVQNVRAYAATLMNKEEIRAVE